MCSNYKNLFLIFLYFQGKTTDSKKTKKDKVDDDAESGEEDVIYDEVNEVDSDIESDEYDLPYDGEEDDIDGEGKF